MKDWHTHSHTHKACLVGYLKRFANYTAFCLSLQKAQRTLVGVWPDVFPVVLYCRMRWRELCPTVVVLARMPLTRWLRRWNMLIKLKTTGNNLHQIVTLVVSRATVRFVFGETCTCWRACLSVCLYVCVFVKLMSVCGVCAPNMCHAASIMMQILASWWQEMSFMSICDNLWITLHYMLHYMLFSGRSYPKRLTLHV